MNKVEQAYNKEIVRFGKRIKELRLARNWTQLDLELASGLSRTEVSRIENGLNNIEFFTIVRLAAALEVGVTELFP